MELKGGCYCQSIKYEINGDVKLHNVIVESANIFLVDIQMLYY